MLSAAFKFLGMKTWMKIVLAIMVFLIVRRMFFSTLSKPAE